ncbi:MAG: D-amino-acid transaminase [Anaerolineae bacterium]
MIVYYNGRFLPKEEVCISPDDRGFLFGDGVYEVIRAYEGVLFHAELHFARLRRSLQEVQITVPDLAELEEACTLLLHKNELAAIDASLYVQITRGVAPRTHHFPEPPPAPTVYVQAKPVKPKTEQWERGVKIILVPDIRWARCDVKSLMLLPNILASQQAHEQDAYDAVFVRDGVVTEGSHTTVCAIFDGTLVTAPVTNNILGGVTREIVLQACRDLNIPVREFPIFESDLARVEELILLGTTTEIMPVVQVNERPVGDGCPGPVTRQLQRAYRDIVRREVQRLKARAALQAGISLAGEGVGPAKNLQFIVTDAGDEVHRALVRKQLKSFNAAVSPLHREMRRSGAEPLDVFVRDESGQLVGGLVGSTHWGWLLVEDVWVAEALRGQGLGRRLMALAEEEARRRGCAHAWLRTFSFQSRGFYEKLGFRVVGQLDDYPPGQTFYWMQKDFDER